MRVQKVKRRTVGDFGKKNKRIVLTVKIVLSSKLENRCVSGFIVDDFIVEAIAGFHLSVFLVDTDEW